MDKKQVDCTEGSMAIEKPANLTVYIYADDVLVKESNVETIWAYVFDRIVAVEQAAARNKPHA